MGGKKRSYSKSKKKGKVVEEIAPEDLDRFAGSSDEEEEQDGGKAVESGDDNSGGDDSSDDDSEMPEKSKKGGRQADQSKPKKKVVLKQKLSKDGEGAAGDGEESASVDGSGSDDDSSDDDEDFDQYDKQQRQKHGAAGMADAMAKILGPSFGSKKPASGTAVLSKTTTPLQRMHQKEKERAKELREKRRLKAINPLPALHIPLSVATSLTVGGTTKSVGQELELERLHRRVATRGVVALFNAVAQHQKKGSGDASTPTPSAKSAEVKKMTKHGFLDMIKTAATASKKSKKGETMEAAPKEKENTSKWAALQDDYMMNPKKNWDESSDESNNENSDREDGPNALKGKEAPAKKRRLVSAR